MGWAFSLALFFSWLFNLREYPILIASALFAIAGSIGFNLGRAKNRNY